MTSAEKAAGAYPFDLLIKNVKIVNVFNDTVVPGSIGICGKEIKFIGAPQGNFQAVSIVDGEGLYALPGFIDSHMHLESSMLSPGEFARCALSCGTTMVAADPHEICNVMGPKGVYALLEAIDGQALKVLMMAPSTVPSAPGFEGSGCAVGPDEVREMLSHPGIFGLGEVMDFNGVADGEALILSIIDVARKRGVIIDGHASVLTGERLQGFAAAGIDSDHTAMTADKLRELLAQGFCVQVQESALNREMAAAMNNAAVSNRICLVTDDVSLDRLMHQGHLNHVVARAIALGLDPLRAIRYASINAADRLRQYHTGAIAPGRIADIQLVKDLRAPKPELLFVDGQCVYKGDRLNIQAGRSELSALRNHPMDVEEVKPADLRLTVENAGGCRYAKLNVIHQDGVGFRTQRKLCKLPLMGDGTVKQVDITGYVKMAVFNRYGLHRHALALIDGMPDFKGAVALTYGHDAHNLTVYGSDDGDMCAAANAVREMHGGICAVQSGEILAQVPLPLGGLMSEEPAEKLLEQMDALLLACKQIGLTHEKPVPFLTLMPLAVSPEIKCTDLGLIDVVNKRMLPLVEEIY